MKIPSFRGGHKLTILLSVALSFTLLSNPAFSGGSNKAASKSGKLTQSYTWFDGSRERKVWLNPQLVAEFNPGPPGEKSVKTADSSAKIFSTKHNHTGIRLWKLNNPNVNTIPQIKARDPQGRYSAVLHDGPSSSSRMRALPGDIIVYLDPKWDEKTINSWLKKNKLEIVKKLEAVPNSYVIKTSSDLEALDIANALYRVGEVKAAFPDWWQEVSPR